MLISPALNLSEGTLLAIGKGAKISIDECKFQFKNRRWNCQTDEATSRGGLVFGKILRIGNSCEGWGLLL